LIDKYVFNTKEYILSFICMIQICYWNLWSYVL